MIDLGFTNYNYVSASASIIDGIFSSSDAGKLFSLF